MKTKTRFQFNGIHHVTGIAGSPQKNYDFYSKTLGLRLVKKTVNQDDVGTYHLFYSDAVGTPGTDITFFAWNDNAKGKNGTRMITSVSLAIPEGSLSFWIDRLKAFDVEIINIKELFDENVIHLRDFHGQEIELVETKDALHRDFIYWNGSKIPEEFSIRGIHKLTISHIESEPTFNFLTNKLGFNLLKEKDNLIRFGLENGRSGQLLDLTIEKEKVRGYYGVGTIHHVAWRVEDEISHVEWWKYISSLDVSVSDVIDRFWFKSIYFREPGGVLFEIATDGPGFSIDESTDELGTRLVLPPWLEKYRAEIERNLFPINVQNKII